MKKYMEPIMESESFVANEYVSACFYFDCKGCNTYDGYARGEAIDQLGFKHTAEYVAASNFAQSNEGILGDDYSTGNYVMFNDKECCKDGCYTEVQEVHWTYKALMDLIYALLGLGTWNPPVVATNNHHHLTARPTNISDPHPNLS